MKQGKHVNHRARCRLSRRAVLSLMLIILVLAASVGTLAFMIARTAAVENSFTPAQVSCEVNDDLTITNTSDVEAYIRAMVVVNWMDRDGNVSGTVPVYEITTNSGWTRDTNTGIYYYNSPVHPEAVDEKLAEIVAPADVDCKEAAPDGYTLTIEVIAEAIQAEGMGAINAQDAWAKAYIPLNNN